MKKIKYEKPTILDAGKVAAVLGQNCSTGNSPAGECIGGSDPHSGPICTPGLTATFNCGAGTTNLSGNCTAGGTAFGCSVGTSPVP